jgi:formylglycine-generating enzyme required for sulfatase activity
MISADSKNPLEAELAALLHGLYYRGLPVGPDDAARIAAVFQHAEGWSHQRRVRVLKSLLARNDEERLLIDQLAPFLFVTALKRAEQAAPDRQAEEPDSNPHAHETEPLTSRLSIPKSPRAARGPLSQRGHFSAPSLQKGGSGGFSYWLQTHWRQLSLALCLIVTAAVAWRMFPSQESQGPPSITWRMFQPQDSHSLLSFSPSTSTPQLPTPQNPVSVELDDTPLVPPSRWPFGVLVVVSCIPILVLAPRFLWVRQQKINLAALAASTGPRSYRLDVPAGQLPTLLDANLVRDAAFQLSAASVAAPAPWLDVRQTVDATVANAGQLTLRFDTWFEHRPVLFIEDVAVSMVRWPGVGKQIADALLRQGSRVEQYYMDRTPELLSHDRNLEGRVALEQVLARLSDPAVIILSDVAALDAYGATAHSSWIGALLRALWLHPRDAAFWGPGAHWLAERLQVVSLTDDSLLRLGAPRTRGDGVLSRRWRPVAVLGQRVEARLAGMRATLGDAAFWWLAAGAVLGQVNVLTTRLWWALRNELLPDTPRERIERVWELPEVRVAADGAVRLETEVQARLLVQLTQERPQLLSKVVAWVERRIAADLQRLDSTSLAALQARVLRTQLQLLDEQRHEDARCALRDLAHAGFGEWVEIGEREAPLLRRWQVSLEPPKKLVGWAWWTVLASLVASLVALVLGVVGLWNPSLIIPPIAPEVVLLQAQVETAPLGNTVTLTWRLQEDQGPNTPTRWRVLRDRVELAQSENMQWQDHTTGKGPWRYQVRAVGQDGWQYRSDVIEVASAEKDTPLPIPSGRMVQVAAGEFFMGCNEAVDKNCNDDEKADGKSGRMVYLDAYAIDEHEVTVADYRRCVEAGGCTDKDLSAYSSCNWDKKERDEHPINCVDWEQAQAYCRSVGKRLPSEAEWEKAARGTDRRVYPWGNTWDDKKANVQGKDTVPVGSYPAGVSPYGAQDMAGNVWEWVQDWYADDYYRNGPMRNPRGPEKGEYRSLRGGSWSDGPLYARASNRGRFVPGYRFDFLGFRCAQ